MPELPANSRYARHSADCRGLGAFGWALQSGEVYPKRHKYFVLVDSSVRGPFMHPYLQVWCFSSLSKHSSHTHYAGHCRRGWRCNAVLPALPGMHGWCCSSVCSGTAVSIRETVLGLYP